MTRHCPTCRCHLHLSLRQQLRLRKLRGERISVLEVAHLVAKETSISVRRMGGPSRSAGVVRARGMAIQLAFAFCDTTKSEIARLFNRDHSTVLHYLRKSA